MERQQSEDEKFMSSAIEEAQKALLRKEVPIGCVIVSQGQIVGRGHNLVETLNDATAHAEMQAITAAANETGGKYLNDCVLYVTVEPCVMCAGACLWSQIGRLVYGASDPKKGFTNYGINLLHPKTKITHGILEEECSLMMKTFFEKLRD